jgi:hypothetical protein
MNPGRIGNVLKWVFDGTNASEYGSDMQKSIHLLLLEMSRSFPIALRMKFGDHMRSTVTRRTTVIVATATTLVVVGGLAYAYWSSTGVGSGSATTGTSTAFVVASSPPTGAALTPGGPTQSVAFSVTNPSSGSQTLANVAITVANADGTAWDAVPGCSALDYTVGVPAITYGQIAPAAAANGTVTIGMNNLGTNQDACQGVAVPLYIVAS